MSQVVNRYDYDHNEKKYVPNGTIPINTSSTNAKQILTALNEPFLYLRTNRNLPDNMKVSQNANIKIMATTKPSMFDFLSKSKQVDLNQLSEDELKNLSLEPTIDVYFSTPAGGWKSRKSRKNRKSRKSRKSR